MFREGDILCSKYKLKRQFNKGGFSSVWLAHDLKAKEDFALKIYDSIEDIEEFRKGFKLVVNLNHSNIFKPLNYDVHDGVPFLVMSYCHNGSATSKIGKMTEDEVWNFAHDVALGLAYLHDYKGIVHQDIKPGNILIDDDGKYMITDFDISTRQHGTRRMTEQQVQEMQDFNYGSGTPPYMGAERWPDKEDGYIPAAKPAQASDIWSLGATLYELMTGQVPYGETGGAYQRSLIKQKNREAEPSISGNYSKDLRKLVCMCLAKDAWKRPTAKQIAEAASQHKAPVPISPNNRQPWRKTISLVGIVTIMMIGVVYYILRPTLSIPPNNSQLYLKQVENAALLIKTQLEDPNRIEESEKFDTYISKINEALTMYRATDTISYVSDSAKIIGENIWHELIDIIASDYHRLDSLRLVYEDIGATSAMKLASERSRELKQFVLNNN